MKDKFQKLIERTKEVATTYTGTFIVLMILNQLLFFGFCLNPICLVAAMPHVLFFTVIVGTWIERNNIIEDKEKSSSQNNKTLYEKPKYTKPAATQITKKPKEHSNVLKFSTFKEANIYASKNTGFIVTRNPDNSGFIAYKK